MKLINGDVLAQETLDQIPNDCDIVFTSPPYNLGNSNYFKEWYNENTDNTGAKYKRNVEADHKDDWVDWLEQVVRTYLDKAEYFFLNLQSSSSNKRDINELLYRLNDVYCDKIIWNKENGIPHGRNSRVMTLTFEEIYIFSKTPNRRVGTKEWKGNVKNLFTMPGNQGNKYAKIHKATFPLSLPHYIFDTFVKPGGKVIDCFQGTGTSGVAAKELGLDYYGVELDQEYHKIAKERIKWT